MNPHQRPPTLSLQADKGWATPAAQIACGKATAQHYLAITTGRGVIIACGIGIQFRMLKLGHPPGSASDFIFEAA